MPAKPSVRELIHRRLVDKTSRPGRRNDPWKLAIVLEGGGMKFVMPAGMMSLLEHYGIAPDLMLGTSAGGVVAAYVAGGNMHVGATNYKPVSRLGYVENGKRWRFIDAKRALKRRPVMDIEGFVEMILTRVLPVNWCRLKQSKYPVYVTSVSRKGQLMLQPLHGVSPQAQKQALKNTSRVPVIAHHGGDLNVLWDGMLLASLPVQQAFDLGATHVLVVRSRGQNEVERKGDDYLTRLIHLALWWQGRDLKPLVNKSHHTRVQSLELLKNPGPELLVMALPRVEVGMAEGDTSKLFRHTVASYHYAADALGLPRAPLPPLWEKDAQIYG